MCARCAGDFRLGSACCSGRPRVYFERLPLRRATLFGSESAPPHLRPRPGEPTGSVVCSNLFEHLLVGPNSGLEPSGQRVDFDSPFSGQRLDQLLWVPALFGLPFRVWQSIEITVLPYLYSCRYMGIHDVLARLLPSQYKCGCRCSCCYSRLHPLFRSAGLP